MNIFGTQSRAVFTIFLVTIVLFATFITFYQLDARYVREHKAELTSSEVIYGVTLFSYADTPYTPLKDIAFALYLFVPALLIIFLSAKFLNLFGIPYITVYAVVLISIALLGTYVTLHKLDASYAIEHRAELTTSERINNATYFHYADTPFTQFRDVALTLYLFIPALIVLVLSGKYLLKNFEKTNYFRSLRISLLFVVITLLLQLPTTYYMEGGITDLSLFGFVFNIMYVLLVLGLVMITNSIILVYKKTI